MSLLVLDASVALQWVVPATQGSHTDAALRLLRDYVNRDVAFVVPDLFWAEIGNVLCKGVRQKRWRREDAEEGIADLVAYNFDTVPSRLVLAEAVQIALASGISSYDCLYVALALQARSELITSDERLVNALAARFPVKWLGTF